MNKYIMLCFITGIFCKALNLGLCSVLGEPLSILLQDFNTNASSPKRLGVVTMMMVSNDLTSACEEGDSFGDAAKELLLE